MSILLNIPLELLQNNVNVCLESNDLFTFYSCNKFLRNLLFEVNTKLTIKDHFDFISKFKNLTYLDINNSKAEKVTFDCKNLKILNLAYCKNITDFSFLENCTKLEELQVYDTNISSVNLKNLLKLKILNFTCCTNLQKLILPKNLEELYLTKTNINNLDCLENLQKLKILNLLHCTNLNEFTKINNLTTLKALYLGFTNIHDLYDINNLRNLERLSLISCKNIENLITLKDFKSLKYLGIMSSNIQNNDINQLIKYLPNLIAL